MMTDPVATALSALLDAIVDRVAERVAAKLSANAPPAIEPQGLLSVAATARALGISPPTLYRSGAPFETVGTRRKYDLATVRAFFAARGKRPTTPASKPTRDNIDVDDIAARAGLRKGRSR